MNETTNGNWQDILKELADAQAAWEEASSAEEAARKRETSALNRLNDAQRQFDLALGALKKNSPRNSNWKQTDRPVVTNT